MQNDFTLKMDSIKDMIQLMMIQLIWKNCYIMTPDIKMPLFLGLKNMGPENGSGFR